MRIVIVDDEPLACERIRTLLAKERDVEILGEFHDGRSAIAGIQELKPELVFLDVQMPECDGFRVVERLTELPIVIFVTAYDNTRCAPSKFARSIIFSSPSIAIGSAKRSIADAPKWSGAAISIAA